MSDQEKTQILLIQIWQERATENKTERDQTKGSGNRSCGSPRCYFCLFGVFKLQTCNSIQLPAFFRKATWPLWLLVVNTFRQTVSTYSMSNVSTLTSNPYCTIFCAIYLYVFKTVFYLFPCKRGSAVDDVPLRTGWSMSIYWEIPHMLGTHLNSRLHVWIKARGIRCLQSWKTRGFLNGVFTSQELSIHNDIV